MSWVQRSAGSAFGAARSLVASHVHTYARLAELLHTNGKVMLGKCNTLCRADLLGSFDGTFSEGAALNAVAWTGVGGRPTILWTYSIQDGDLDAFSSSTSSCTCSAWRQYQAMITASIRAARLSRRRTLHTRICSTRSGASCGRWARRARCEGGTRRATSSRVRRRRHRRECGGAGTVACAAAPAPSRVRRLRHRRVCS